MTDMPPASPEHAATEHDPAGPDRSDLRDAFGRVRSEVAKAVVGQEGAVSGMIVGLLAQGHVLLEGVPGVAKTLLVRSLAASMSLDTKRIQFTPDLMPGDVTGSLVYDASTGTFPFREGPVFTNVLLADEVNRTPRRPSRRSSRPWRNGRSASTVTPVRCPTPSSSPRP